MKRKCDIAGWLGFLVCVLMAGPVHGATESLTIPVALETMKQSNEMIRDMTCIFVKTITKSGKSFPETQMKLNYIKEPEVIYLEFINRFPGQKCLYAEGENQGKLKVRPSGFMKFTTLNLDPEGDMAMVESLEPVTAISFNSVIQNFELFYTESLKVSNVAISVKTDVSEDNDLYHLLMITSDSGEFFNMYIHRKTCLPYKIQYKRGTDMATYVYKDMACNTHLNRSDLNI